MRFTTDDSAFGVLVSPRPGYGLFRFQLLLNGELIGDAEPGMLGSAMARLNGLAVLDDPRLEDPTADAAATLELLLADEDLGDPTLFAVAESLDRWHVRAYRFADQVAFLAAPVPEEDGAPLGPVSVSVVSFAEYEPIATEARRYWRGS
ncbi:hypothetical protein GCM10009839_45150 [Catenulispora yoronensis]|uniref:Uncharacterized protein n=1 Tax=Catenulispora yoronensis TaxID=450799 RepID=A0ABN2UIR3_9ACTN